jgi:2-oxo-4-hydroxy-4-carboxy-5-ureidoimidazoline decarboxylase
VTIADLNARDREGFVEAIGWVFESSPWVAERAWTRAPFSSLDELHSAMAAAVTAACLDEQLALLRAHPDLGSRARMSTASLAEQSGAGLDSLTGEEFERLGQLNAEYRDRFGFPFLYAVKGSSKHDILDALERRLQSAPGDERTEGLRQVSRIARFRLEEMIS